MAIRCKAAYNITDIMATRLIIQCFPQTIPGKPSQWADIMADIICQHKWQRDFDKSQDRLRSTGQYAYDNLRCIFVLDNGPPDSEDISVSMYTWDGGKLAEMPVSPIVKSHLRHYPFNPANASPGLHCRRV